MVMSALVCCSLVSFAWYEFAVVPIKNAAAAAAANTAKIQAELDEQKKKDEAEAAARALLVQNQHGTIKIDSNPTGATATIGNARKTTPATFADLTPDSKVTLTIHADVMRTTSRT